MKGGREGGRGEGGGREGGGAHLLAGKLAEDGSEVAGVVG